jgi:hypothetical protein
VVATVSAFFTVGFSLLADEKPAMNSKGEFFVPKR